MDSEKRMNIEQELQKLQARRQFNRTLVKNTLAMGSVSDEEFEADVRDHDAIRVCDIRFLSEISGLSFEEIWKQLEEME